MQWVLEWLGKVTQQSWNILTCKPINDKWTARLGLHGGFAFYFLAYVKFQLFQFVQAMRTNYISSYKCSANTLTYICMFWLLWTKSMQIWNYVCYIHLTIIQHNRVALIWNILYIYTFQPSIENYRSTIWHLVHLFMVNFSIRDKINITSSQIAPPINGVLLESKLYHLLLVKLR